MKVSKCSRGITRKVRGSDQQNRWCQLNTVFQGFSEDLSGKPGMIFDVPPITDPASLFQPDEGAFGQAPASGHACQELIASRHTGPTLFFSLPRNRLVTMMAWFRKKEEKPLEDPYVKMQKQMMSMPRELVMMKIGELMGHRGLMKQFS